MTYEFLQGLEELFSSPAEPLIIVAISVLPSVFQASGTKQWEQLEKCLQNFILESFRAIILVVLNFDLFEVF
jgi:hypothetical protein